MVRKMKKMKGHTGHIRPKTMTSLMDGHGSQDPHADASHHSMNKMHGTPHGMSPMGDYGDGDEGKTEGLEGCNSDYD